jgi:hypothetical protein
MWDRFWNSALEQAPETDNVSVTASQKSERYEQDSVAETRSIQAMQTTQTYVPGQGFTFKIQTKTGVHKFRTTGDSLVEFKGLLSRICNFGEDESFIVSYKDDDDDLVVISTEEDLVDSIQHAMNKGHKYVRLEIASVTFTLEEPPSNFLGLPIKQEYALLALAGFAVAFFFFKK